MKRILALMLVLSLVLVGCESNPNAIAKFSRENWKEVISENFGFEIPEPEGWAIESMENNRTNKVDINFVLDGEETFDSFGEKLFDAIEDGAVGSVKQGFDTSIEPENFDDANIYGNVVFVEYDKEDYYVECYFYDNGGTAELVLNRRTK